MKVAIIPARGGSERIPDKNIKNFAGLPIIAYSIKAAQQSDLFDRIIVSTDSKEIASVAESYGAEVPFRRPSELADDFTPLAQVLLHALQWLGDHKYKAEYLCCILATAPFVTPEFIKQGHEKLISNQVTTVIAVTSFSFPVFRAMQINDQGSLEMIWPENELKRSNDLPVVYHDAGQFYWLDVKSFQRSGKIYSRDAKPVILPRYLVQDIDTPEDWLKAEKMFKAL